MDKRLYSPALSAALAQLSLEERNILVLRVFEELTFSGDGRDLEQQPQCAAQADGAH
ncbi:hypothetical protein [Paenibacillus graminis]|uniref:hypothetical protein n=1 Tax=Paenibacillus graminis TaxID=189425 RepID=UPI001FD49A1A|nr:hypothetical protein [Paenibacillus graminis]